MKILKILFVLPFLFCNFSAIAAEENTEQNAAVIEVHHAYMRGLIPGNSNTAAYMTLKNTGEENVELVKMTNIYLSTATVKSLAKSIILMHKIQTRQ